MMHLRRAATWIALPVMLLAAGCSGAPAGQGTGQSSAPAEAPAAGAVQGQTKVAPKQFRARRGGGPALRLLESSLNKLELDNTQKKTVEGLIAQLRPQRGQELTLHKDMMQALSSGKVDRAAFDKDFAQLENNVRARVNKTADVLNQLHATLDPADRALLVDQVKTQLASLKQHRCAWRARAHAHHHRGQWLAKKLDLSPAQIATLKADRSPEHAKDERHERGAMLQKLLDAFVQDQFDAHQLLNADNIATRARSRAERRLAHIQELTSVLTVEQRAKFAARMQARRTGRMPTQRVPLANPNVAQ